MYIYDTNPHQQTYTTLGYQRGRQDAASLTPSTLERFVNEASDKSEHAHLERDRWYYAGYVQGAYTEVTAQWNATPSYVERFKDGREEVR